MSLAGASSPNLVRRRAYFGDAKHGSFRAHETSQAGADRRVELTLAKQRVARDSRPALHSAARHPARTFTGHRGSRDRIRAAADLS